MDSSSPTVGGDMSKRREPHAMAGLEDKHQLLDAKQGIAQVDQLALMRLTLRTARQSLSQRVTDHRELLAGIQMSMITRCNCGQLRMALVALLMPICFSSANASKFENVEWQFAVDRDAVTGVEVGYLRLNHSAVEHWLDWSEGRLRLWVTKDRQLRFSCTAEKTGKQGGLTLFLVYAEDRCEDGSGADMESSETITLRVHAGAARKFTSLRRSNNKHKLCSSMSTLDENDMEGQAAFFDLIKPFSDGQAKWLAIKLDGEHPKAGTYEFWPKPESGSAVKAFESWCRDPARLPASQRQ